MSVPLFIYGSCVSRDTPRIVRDRFDVVHYTARQSWISAFSQPTPIPDLETKLTSAFQKRLVNSDLQSKLPEILREHADRVGVLMLDLVDERVGVLPTVPGGYVTNTFEFRNSGWAPAVATGELVEMGSKNHLALWQAASHQLLALLEELDLVSRTVLIKATFATASKQGDDLAKMHPRAWNERYEPYYEHAERLGLNVVSVPDEAVLADREHEWGLQPYHYVSDFYQEVATRVMSN